MSTFATILGCANKDETFFKIYFVYDIYFELRIILYI